MGDESALPQVVWRGKAKIRTQHYARRLLHFNARDVTLWKHTPRAEDNAPHAMERMGPYFRRVHRTDDAHQVTNVVFELQMSSICNIGIWMHWMSALRTRRAAEPDKQRVLRGSRMRNSPNGRQADTRPAARPRWKSADRPTRECYVAFLVARSTND